MNTQDSRGAAQSSMFGTRQLTDYQVNAGDPDVRGWAVVGSDNQQLGVVEDVIVDSQTRKIRYLDILLNPSASAENVERHILLPVGIAVANEKDDVIHVENVETPTLVNLPPYQGEPITREYEDSIVQVLRPSLVNTSNIRDEFYSHEHFDEHRFYSARRPREGQFGTQSFYPFQSSRTGK